MPGPKPYALGDVCRGGHLLTEHNTYVEGKRLRCETCYNIRKGLPENQRRTKIKKLVLGGTCSRGHELTEQSVYVYPDGKMACKVCRRDATRKSQGLPPADPNEPLENWTRDKDRKKTHCPQGHPYDTVNTYITPDGSRKCRKCSYDRNRERQYRDNYGITIEQFDEMLLAQNNLCAICQEEFIQTPYVDHNHDTGQVRELLCNGCNAAIGHMRENPQYLIAAANYIIKHQS